MSEIVDVLVVGGGPVGACVAALLASGSRTDQGSLSGGDATRSTRRIMVLEPRRPTAPLTDAPLDSRVVALSRASERILAAAGAWQRLPAHRVESYETMRIWHESVAPASTGTLVFDAAESSQPNLGYILENRVLQTALLDAVENAGGRIEPAEVQGAEIGAEYVKLATSSGEISARLVVGADGAQSAVRRAVGLSADISDFHQLAIVANVATARPHAHTAWQRFMRDGTLAFLPLADGTSSIVWSADVPLANRLNACTPAEFEQSLDRASDLALGATRLVSERTSFPLRRLDSQRFCVQRCALIGDAAHVVHPLAGQGVNLGLLDAAALSQLVLEAWHQSEDPGSLRVLRRYERWRKSETALMSSAISMFDRVLAHGSGPVSQLAQRGLGWINRSPQLKRLFANRALGVSGDLPRAAR